jgi:hypothetical protein
MYDLALSAAGNQTIAGFITGIVGVRILMKYKDG